MVACLFFFLEVRRSCERDIVCSSSSESGVLLVWVATRYGVSVRRVMMRVCFVMGLWCGGCFGIVWSRCFGGCWSRVGRWVCVGCRWGFGSWSCGRRVFGSGGSG